MSEQHRFYGKYRGTVESNEDPLQLGRLQLLIPSVLHDQVTDWAWPCVPFGGLAEQGTFFVPEKDASVWVEFEEGNVDQPIWVGTFWTRAGNATTIPAEAQQMTSNHPWRRVLKTSAGHTVEFCDESGKESVTIKHTGGAMLTMDEKGSLTVVNKNGSVLYLNADGREVLLADENGNFVGMTDGGITVSGKDGSAVDVSKDAVQVIAKSVLLRSQTVSLGEGASEPAILGAKFATAYDSHVHPTAMGPSGPPMPVPMPLSSPMHPAMSKSVKVK
jgi:hypothetical protein